MPGRLSEAPKAATVHGSKAATWMFCHTAMPFLRGGQGGCMLGVGINDGKGEGLPCVRLGGARGGSGRGGLVEGDQAGLRGLFVLSITADCFPPLPPPSHSPSLRLTITQFAFTPTNRRPGRCYAPPPRTLLLGRACACVSVGLSMTSSVKVADLGAPLFPLPAPSLVSSPPHSAPPVHDLV